MESLIKNVEGIDASEWEFLFGHYYDGKFVLDLEYEIYIHPTYKLIELEVDSDQAGGDWRFYVRWGSPTDEMVFMTLDEAKEWLESEEGTAARVWGELQSME